MKTTLKKEDTYKGFEQGPIRPPSEAASLLIRVTRNCPWNRCKFCPVYKGEKFSLREVVNVKKDIDQVAAHLESIQGRMDRKGNLDRGGISEMAGRLGPDQLQAFGAAMNWAAGGMESIFLQDANSLVIKPENLVEILEHIRNRFPWVNRITSYARSHTIARIKGEDMAALSKAGLNRIHIGLESGSDQVLEMVQKGVTKDIHVKAGRKVKMAGMELSEYVMPGLGGRDLSMEHAAETADALNRIGPDFIRLRSLAVPESVELYDDLQSGKFRKCTDTMMAEEILVFIEALEGITSMVQSDHVLNLFQDVEGRLPGDREKMTGTIKRFLGDSPERRVIYQVGRRLGVFSRLDDMEDGALFSRADQAREKLGITADNVDAMMDEMMKRFV